MLQCLGVAVPTQGSARQLDSIVMAHLTNFEESVEPNKLDISLVQKAFQLQK